MDENDTQKSKDQHTDIAENSSVSRVSSENSTSVINLFNFSNVHQVSLSTDTFGYNLPSSSSTRFINGCSDGTVGKLWSSIIVQENQETVESQSFADSSDTHIDGVDLPEVSNDELMSTSPSSILPSTIESKVEDNSSRMSDLLPLRSQAKLMQNVLMYVQSGFTYLPSYMSKDPAQRQRCQVCDDLASGIHYGIFTCEGCKGFFRRIVQHRMQGVHNYACKQNGNCSVLSTNRTDCQACRFKRCLEAGMKQTSVLTHAERRAKQLKIQQNRERQKWRLERAAARRGVRNDEFHLHSAIGETSESHCALLRSPKAIQQQCQRPSYVEQVDSLLAVFISKRLRIDSINSMRCFIAELPGIQLLSDEVRSRMLHSAVSILYCLDLAYSYDPTSDSIAFSEELIIRNVDASDESVCCLVFRLGQSLKHLQLDRTELSLLAAAAVVRPSDTSPADLTFADRLTQWEIFDRLIDALNESSRVSSPSTRRQTLCMATALEIIDQIHTVAHELENMQLLTTSSDSTLAIKARRVSECESVPRTLTIYDGLCYIPYCRAMIVFSC